MTEFDKKYPEVTRLLSELSTALDRYLGCGPIVFFVGMDGVAHTSRDWAAPLRAPRLEGGSQKD
jgi:hypothetical protein